MSVFDKGIDVVGRSVLVCSLTVHLTVLSCHFLVFPRGLWGRIRFFC